MSDEELFKIKVEAIKDMANPNIIIHPDYEYANQLREFGIPITYHRMMQIDRIIFIDKANLYQFNLDDFKHV